MLRHACISYRIQQHFDFGRGKLPALAGVAPATGSGKPPAAETTGATAAMPGPPAMWHGPGSYDDANGGHDAYLPGAVARDLVAVAASLHWAPPMIRRPRHVQVHECAPRRAALTHPVTTGTASGTG